MKKFTLITYLSIAERWPGEVILVNPDGGDADVPDAGVGDAAADLGVGLALPHELDDAWVGGAPAEDGDADLRARRAAQRP